MARDNGHYPPVLRAVCVGCALERRLAAETRFGGGLDRFPADLGDPRGGWAAAGPGDELVTCTVRGTSTLKSTAEAAGLFRDVEGQRFYFCCRRCQDLFDAEHLASNPAA